MTSRSFFVLAMFVSACGGIAGGVPDAGPGDDGGPPPTSNGCPSAAPAAGASCSESGLECEYGTDVRSTCNTVMTCSNGRWIAPLDGNSSCPTGPNPSECPASFDAAQGTCGSVGTSCNYSTSSATRFCSCIDFGGPILLDGGGPTGSWMCTNDGQSCPAERPRIGDTCSSLGTQCSYDSCGLPDGLSFQCSADTGTWIIGPAELCASANANGP